MQIQVLALLLGTMSMLQSLAESSLSPIAPGMLTPCQTSRQALMRLFE